MTHHNIVTLDYRDLNEIEAHLKRLDKGDRYLRFFAALGDSAIEHYAHNIDLDNGKLFGSWNQYGDLIGYAQLAGIGLMNDRKSAEFAMSIDKEHRGTGLARQLMKRCINFCKADGIEFLFMSCLRENQKMRALAQAEGLKVVVDHEEAIAELNLDGVVTIERGLAVAKELQYAQISIFDKAYRFNNDIIRALLGHKLK
jgi:GNAT superfamily N-acetyltransferase